MTKKTALILAIMSTPAIAAPVPANQFECEGRHVSITYSTSSITGVPVISIQRNGETVARSGEEIQVQETVLGSLVTVVVDSIPDAFTDTYTLLVPNVNVPENIPDVQFFTQFYSTRTNDSIGGPSLVSGLIQESAAERVSCMASAVAF